MTRDQIARKVQGKSPLTVELVKGEGYWYFTATLTNAAGTVVFYETESVYTMRLNDMTDAQWIETGAMFVLRREQEARERGLID